MAEPADEPEVDLRILQANERTLLAWVRTGLALMAFGFVVARISPWLNVSDVSDDGIWSLSAGAVFLSFGIACHIVAAYRYDRVRTAIIAGQHIIPGRAATLALALGLALLGAAILLYLLVM